MAAGSSVARAAGATGIASASPAVAAAAASRGPEQNPQQGQEQEQEEDARWRPALGLPCQLTVDLPLPGFTVADFLKLRGQSVIDAHWRLGHDLPLRLNGMLIGWIEFEVVGNNLAVRLTELA